MQIKKQDINVGKAIFSGDIKSGAEGSIIVPDVKPDILKVLQVDAESFLEEKTIEDGKLILKGKVYINALYTPESEGDCVKNLNGVFEFCETVKRPDFQNGMSVNAVCDTVKVGYKLINSRKIGIEAHIEINVSVTAQEKLSFVCGIDSENAELITKNISVKEASENKDFTFRIDENIELPRNDGVEILKSNVKITEKDCRTITGKVIVKGKAVASVLYTTDKGSYEHYDFELPFTEVFDWENAVEDCDCDISCEISDFDFKIKSGTDEGAKCVSVFVQVQVLITMDTFKSFECIKDCYFTEHLCEIEHLDIDCEEICAKPELSTIVKHVIEKEENLPEISGIFTSVAKPYITSTDVQNGRIAVSGKIMVYLLYLSDDSQNPLSGLTEEIPFSHMLECSDVSRETDVMLSVECEHISCTINTSSSVEVRCGICIRGKASKISKIKVIKDITLREKEEKDKAMVVYFVKNGDTLWDIGKKYRVRCQDIKECNCLENESLSVGQKIVIPVSKK